jgi:hypothetical protein
MSKKYKSAPPSAIHMKNQPKPIRTVEKLHTKNPLVKGEQIVDI